MELSQTFSQCRWGYLKDQCQDQPYLHYLRMICCHLSAQGLYTCLNRALQEIYHWWCGNQLTPHPEKSEAMLLCRGNPMGSIAPVLKAHVLCLTVNHKLTWDTHVMDVKKSFVTNLDLLKWSRFLPKRALRDFYFHPLRNTDLFFGGHVVTQIYSIRLKDFNVGLIVKEMLCEVWC